MTDVGSAVGGLVLASIFGTIMLSGSLVFVGIQLAKISDAIRSNKPQDKQ